MTIGDVRIDRTNPSR